MINDPKGALRNMDSHGTTPRILLIEDDIDTADLISEVLCDHFRANCVHHIETIAQMDTININTFDIIFSDFNLPDGTGLDILALCMNTETNPAVIMVTGQNEIETARQAIRAGAYDYIIKSPNFLDVIPLTAEKNIVVRRIKKENAELQVQLEESLDQIRESNEQLGAMIERLEEMALTDQLTGLANRHCLSETLTRMYAASDRYGTSLSCIMIDLDGFKGLNDTEGHQRGDELLCLAGRIITANCRQADIAARYGGDEFIILLPQTDCDTAANLAERIYHDFTKATRSFGRRPLPISLSLGIACTNVSQPAKGEHLISHADNALYAAKQAGKGRIMLCEPDGETAVRHQLSLTRTPFEPIP